MFKNDIGKFEQNILKNILTFILSLFALQTKMETQIKSQKIMQVLLFF